LSTSLTTRERVRALLHRLDSTGRRPCLEANPADRVRPCTSVTPNTSPAVTLVEARVQASYRTRSSGRRSFLTPAAALATLTKRVTLLMAGGICVVGWLMLATPGVAVAGECANEALRTGPSAQLPDCRAYELVTPTDQNGQELGGGGVRPFLTNPVFDLISTNGRGLLYGSNAPIPGSPNSNSDVLLALRGTDAWTSMTLAPVTSLFSTPDATPSVEAVGASPDISRVLLKTTGSLDPTDQHPTGTELYLRNPDGSYEWISHGTLGQAGAGAALFSTESGLVEQTSLGTSEELNHIVFSWFTPLLPEAEGISAGRTGLYDRSAGTTTLVDLKSDGSLINSCGASLGGTGAVTVNGDFGGSLNAVSNDGSRVFFESSSYTGEPCEERGQFVAPQLYLRESGRSTTEVSQSQKTNGTGAGGADPNGPGVPVFLDATPDGQSVVFADNQELTNSANTGENDESDDLYEYNVTTGSLIDLSATSSDVSGAQVRGLVGMSTDGQIVYFIADGELNGHGIAGQPNLYMWHSGDVQYVGTLGHSEDDSDVYAQYTVQTARVSPNGVHLVFESTHNLTSYNSEGYVEIYDYDAEDQLLTCVSCDPTGAQPEGNATLSSAGVSTAYGFPPPNNLSDDGTYVFFMSPDPLVPQAVSGTTNVYEWTNGRLYLISQDTDRYGAAFLGATASGSDIYFATNATLVSQDQNAGQSDIYDARIAGGFPPAEREEACDSLTECRATPAQPLALGLPTTSTEGEASFGPSPTVVPSGVSQPRASTRAQKLTAAVKLCRRHKQKTKRASCEKAAREKLGPVKKAKGAKASRRAMG
jgi:hypothetical protein